MNISKYLLGSALAVFMGLAFTSCDKDEFTPSIFPDVPTTADPESATYQFDTWLNENFRDVYNMEFIYRMKDVETDYDYNVTPASLENAKKIAVLTKYVWYDAYAEAYGGSADNLDPNFIRQTGPKMLQVIGSYMHNNDGTITYGYASGGVKITLTSINHVNFNDITSLNNLYFHTMHHEFAHILHQTKSYPTEFNTLSNGKYDGSNWGNRNGGLCASLGFISPYGSSSPTEDFAETVSHYITRTDKDYEMIYWAAERGWYSGEDDTDQSAAYCYYYYKDDDDRNNEVKTGTLYYSADGMNANISLRESAMQEQGGSATLTGRYFTTVEEIEDYLVELETRLKNNYKNNQAQSRFDKKYDALDEEQKAIIDGLADQQTFVYPVEDTDKYDGKSIIEQKIQIARQWFKDAWKLDLDNLRAVVQRRNSDYNLPLLLQQIDAIPIPNK